MKKKAFLKDIKSIFKDIDLKKSHITLTQFYESTGIFSFRILFKSLKTSNRSYEIIMKSDTMDNLSVGEKTFEAEIHMNFNGEKFTRKVGFYNCYGVLIKKPVLAKNLDRIIRLYLRKFKSRTYKKVLERIQLPEGKYVYDYNTLEIHEQKFHPNSTAHVYSDVFSRDDYLGKFKGYSLEVVLNDQKTVDKIKSEINNKIDTFARRVGFIS